MECCVNMESVQMVECCDGVLRFSISVECNTTSLVCGLVHFYVICRVIILQYVILCVGVQVSHA